jgi:phosphoglycerate dehydrogenase-like enzyme
MHRTDNADPLHIGLMVKWQPHERAFVEHACPPTMVCHFLEDDPGKEVETLKLLHVLVVGTQAVSSDLIAAAPRLQLIQRWGTGFDNVDLVYARSRSITTAELPGVNARSVSEFIICAILALFRHLPEVTAAWADGRWLGGAQRVPAHRLEGKTVGLLGFGAIGQDVARLLTGFSVITIYHDLAHVAHNGLNATSVSKEELLRVSDVICVQLPLTPATSGAIGEAEIALMKPSATVISVSRAGVVDEGAVRAAVRAKRLFAASFDNFEVEPLPRDKIHSEPRILATPHIAGATVEGFQALVRACFERISLAYADETACATPE